MSKPIRRQLADAHQEIRDLKNAAHAAEFPLRRRIAELEAQNEKLSAELVHAHRHLYAIEVLKDAIGEEVTKSAMGITDARRSLATGKSTSNLSSDVLGDALAKAMYP